MSDDIIETTVAPPSVVKAAPKAAKKRAPKAAPAPASEQAEDPRGKPVLSGTTQLFIRG